MSPALLWTILFLAARLPVRLAAVYGVSPQVVWVFEDAQVAGLVISIAALVIAIVTGQRSHRWILLAESWAVLSLAVLALSWAQALAGAGLVLALGVAIDLLRRKTLPAAGGVSKKAAAALMITFLLILPLGALERALARFHLAHMVRDHSATQVRDWVTAATLSEVRLDPSALAAVGRTVLSQGTDEAWGASLGILTARWAVAEPSVAEPIRAPVESPFRVWGSLQVTVAPIAEGLFVSRARGAGAVGLDGLQAKRIIFHRIPLAYNGGSIDLDRSEFPHCSFFIVRSEGGRRFVEAALGEGPVEFHFKP